MQIHQIQARYDEVQDRVLFRISATDKTEYPFWFTRRYLQRLWGLLLKMLEMDQSVAQQADVEAKKAVLGMKHEEAVQQGEFGKPYVEESYTRPLGPEPVLAAVAEGKRRPDGGLVLSVRPQQGQGIDLALDIKLLHTICKLLIDAEKRTEWGLQLAMPGAAQVMAEAVPANRVLN